MARLGVAWLGAARLGAARQGKARLGPARRGMARLFGFQHNQKKKDGMKEFTEELFLFMVGTVTLGLAVAALRAAMTRGPPG